VIQDCCNFLKFSALSDLLAVRYATCSNRYTIAAIDCTKIYIGILNLNKLTFLCCSLGYLCFVFSIVSMLPCIILNKDFHK